MKVVTIFLAIALTFASCTSVSSKRLILAGTDGEDIEYTANANTGEVHFKAKNVNNSKSTSQVVGLAKYGINIWGLASVAKVLSNNYTNTTNTAAKQATAQTAIKSNEVIKVKDIAAGVEKTKIAAELATKTGG